MVQLADETRLMSMYVSVHLVIVGDIVRFWTLVRVNHVKIVEFVMSWTLLINVLVSKDSMGRTVKKVSVLINHNGNRNRK